MNKSLVAVGLGVALGCIAAVPAVVARLRPEPVTTATVGKWVLLAPPRVGETGVGLSVPLSKWVVVRNGLLQRQWCDNLKTRAQAEGAEGDYNALEKPTEAPKTVAELASSQTFFRKWTAGMKCIEQSDLEAAVRAEPREVWVIVQPTFHADRRLHKVVIDDDKPLDKWSVLPDSKTTFPSQEACEANWAAAGPVYRREWLRSEEDKPEEIAQVTQMLDDIRCFHRTSK